MKCWRYLIVAVVVGLTAFTVGAGLAPIGGSFLVNTVTEGSQRAPGVAFGGDGGALIVWDTDAAGQPEIAGRRIAPDGQPVGDEISLSPLSDTSQIRPSVAGLSGGGFVVAWESYDFDDELLVQRVGADGNLVGDEIRVKDTDLHLHADVASAAGGGFVVVWDDGFDILGRRFDANGQPVGGRFSVNAQQGTMYGPRIASDASGAFAVVWEDRSGIDGDGDGIRLRRFNPQGAPAGGDIQVNSTVEGDQYGPAIGMRPDGAFVVVWESYGQKSVGDGAFAQVFDSGGVPVGGEFRVDSGESSYAGFVAAAPTDNGFIVSWNQPRDNSLDLLNTFVRRVDVSGAAGQIIDVDPEEQGGQAQGKLATMGDRLMVVWEGFGPESHDVFAQQFELVDSTPLPTITPISTPSPTPTPYECPETDLGSPLTFSVTDNTSSKPNQLVGSCGGGEASEATFSYTAPVTGTYVIDTVGSTYDTVLYVRDGTCDGLELACNDDFGGVVSRVTLPLSAGATIAIVVDGFGSGAGEFVLNLAATPATPSPTPTPCPGNECLPLSVQVGTVSGVPGQRVEVPVKLYTGGEAIPGLEVDITFDPQGIPVGTTAFSDRPLCNIDQELSGLFGFYFNFSFLPNGCVKECSAFRAVVVSFVLDLIPDDTNVFSCFFDISPNAQPGLYPIKVAQSRAIRPDGTEVELPGVQGAILVEGGPTPTGTAPISISTPTSTSTALVSASPEPTVTSATSAPTGTVTPTLTCPGDCNDDGVVAINELIRGVNIALGNASLDQCAPFDRNGDGAVTINELIAAVNSALRGCPGVGG